MATIHIDIPDALRERMESIGEENWSAIAAQAFESHLERLAVKAKIRRPMSAVVERLQASKATHEEAEKNAGYGFGYAWARDRAEFHDLQSVVDAPDYRSAANAVRKIHGFSQRDEFGDTALPSDEMWEGFVDGATALYNDVAGRL